MSERQDNTEWEDLEVSYLPNLTLVNEAGTPGAYVIGKFMGSREVDATNPSTMQPEKKKIHRIAVEETNAPISKDEDGHLIELPLEKGMLVEVWGTGQMNFFLSKVVPGRKIKLTYEGKKKIAGGFRAHQFDFKQAKEAPLETTPKKEEVSF